MASGSSNPDVSEQFQKMGEKLGWFKHGDLDAALKSLSKSTKKKKSTKSRIRENEKTGDTEGNKPKLMSQKVKIPKEKLVPPKTPTTNTLRKVDFSGFLSSDSDTSFTTVAENFNKSKLKDKFADMFVETAPRNEAQVDRDPRKVICSDSEEEKAAREDTYISCIGESQLCTSDYSDVSPGDRVSRQSNGSSNAYDESIMQKMVSMTSMSMDVDSIGEPLVESTRIHRRSSVTYKQLMLSSPEGEEGSEEIYKTSRPNKNPYNTLTHKAGTKLPKRNIDDNLCEAVEQLNIDKGDKSDPIRRCASDPDTIDESVEESPECDVRYTTAFESLDDVEESRLDTPNNTSNSSNDTDYVEVTDVGTQTELNSVVCKVSDDSTPSRHENRPVCGLYADETLISPKSPTVHDDKTFVGVCDRSDDYESSHKGERQGMDGLVDMEDISKDVYLSTTTTNDSHKQTCVYDQTTLSNVSVPGTDILVTDVESMDHVYSQITVDMTNTIETDNESSIEAIEKHKSNISTDSDTSVFEVVDVCTQTDRVSVSSVDNVMEDIDGRTGISIDCREQKDANISNELESNDSDLIDEESIHKVSDNARFSTEEFEEGDIHKSINSTNADPDISRVNASLERKFSDSDPDIDVSKSDSTANNKGKPQKASHCFEISSDSDSSEGEPGGTNFSENNSHATNDGSVERHSVESVECEDVVESENETESTDGSDGGLKSYTNMRRDRNTVEVPKVQDSQRWRDSQVNNSDSSDDDNLDAFLQKLKQPEKKKSPASSPKSMDDFIVEDDDMTSESDDEEFYLRENQQLEKSPLIERIKSNSRVPSKHSDDSDNAFSSKIYPSSVTKHKQKKRLGTHRDVKSSSLFWDSSDSDEDLPEIYHKKNRQKSHHTKRTSSQSFSSSTGSERDSPEKKSRKNKPAQTKKSPVSKSGDDLPVISRGKTRPESNQSNTKKNLTNWSSDSDSDSPMFKTPNPIRKIKRSSTEVNEEKDQTDSVFKTPITRPKSSFTDYISLSDDSTSNDDSLPSLSTSNKENVPEFKTPVKPKPSDSSVIFKVPTPLSKVKTPRGGNSAYGRGGNYCSFLGSLSTSTEDHRRDPDAVKYMKNFKKTREDLTKHLFDLYNTTVFDKKLPADLPIIWNKRLLKTAGYCAYRCSKANKEDRTARIELSTKVCDSAERVRDTLIHELCHAAVWLLNGVNGGHGNFWKYWARHASKVHHELPSISRCHSYSIATKFTYRCTRCGYSVGRHSKSLDTSRKICGYCKGTFELIQNSTPLTPQSASGSSVGSTPRTPNRFALFVKDNYNVVKKKNKNLKHGDVMKQLSKEFAASKLTS